MKATNVNLARLAFGLAAVMTMPGCSSWRYRGFLDEAQQVDASRAKGAYRIESVEFGDFHLDMAVGDNSVSQWVANKAYVPYFNQLASYDTRKGGSYVADIAAAAEGFCSQAVDATPVKVRLLPHPEETRGFLSFLFPCAITLGVVPSNKSRDIPFDVEVSFPDTGKSFTSAAVVRIDSRFALSPLGSNRYPTLSGTEACETMAGAWIFDSRNDLLRAAFVKTIASAVKRAIAEREGLAVSDHAPIEYEKDEVAAQFKPVELKPIKMDPLPAVDEPRPGHPMTEKDIEDAFFK